MKRIVLTLMGIIAFAGAACAQNYIVVDSEKIFKSIASYNEAIKTLDELAESYQKQVDDKFADVEKLYNNYMAQKSNLSDKSRQTIENAILSREEDAAKFQESLFGTDGTLMKKRIELIQPIQNRVFKAIEEYAAANNYDLVLDTASNPTILFYSAAADHTDAIIALLK